MTIDYATFPKQSLTRVVHPSQQVVGHPHNNVAWAVPDAILGQFYRPANPDAGRPEPWYLDADSPRWAADLLPWAKALKLYSTQKPTQSAEELARKLAEDRHRVAREQYRAAVQALPGGMDPLWRYSSDGDDVAGEDDLRFMVGQHTIGGWSRTWYPRVVLRLRYGTTSLREYAERNGIAYPG